MVDNAAASVGEVGVAVVSTVVGQEDIPLDLEVVLRAEAVAAAPLLVDTGVEHEVEPLRVRRRWFRKLPQHGLIGSRGFGRRWDHWNAFFRLRQWLYEVLGLEMLNDHVEVYDISRREDGSR